MSIVKLSKRLGAAVISFLTGVPELTPRQKAVLAEIEKEHSSRSQPALAVDPAGPAKKCNGL